MQSTHYMKTVYEKKAKAIVIPPQFSPNKVLSSNANNPQHNELQTKFKQAKTNGGQLHLSSFNIDEIYPQIFQMTFLIRLDLSYNNIRELPIQIGNLSKLKQLWLNNNPLREVPVELCQCQKLQELDLKDTEVSRIPRELASLRSLIFLNLNQCPLKPSLIETYGGGVVQVHQKLNRKDDRKLYKQKLFNRLSQWIYPSETKEDIMSVLNEVFLVLKDASTDMLRKLYRNCQIIFPPKFYQIKPENIKLKLDNVCEQFQYLFDLNVDKQWNDRQQTAQIQLRLKFYYRDQPLADVAKLAGDIFTTMPNLDSLQQIFRFKKYVFLRPFKYLTAQDLFDNLERYKEQRRRQKVIVKEALGARLKEIFQKQSKLIVFNYSILGGVNEEILNKFHAIKFQELRQLLRQAKPVYDFEKKIFLALSDTQIVESFCQTFNHKPSAALKIKYLTPIQVEEGDQMD